ncbi:bifunctional oligoribonuclease/PAP phosphatase NrnA [Spirochaetota bacterium]
MHISGDKLISALTKYNCILIFIKGSPDPDSIASSFALKLICSHLGIKSSIIAEKKISLPQNREFVDKLEIPIEFNKPNPGLDKYDAYIITDHQSAHAEGISGKIPCAIHIDHHEKVKEDINIDYQVINTEVGSTSTIISLLLNDLNIEFNETDFMKVTTALLYGIQTDTDKFTHANKTDYKALDYLSKHFDTSIIKEVSDLPLSEHTIKLLWKAIENQFAYKDWIIAGIGFIDDKHRDSIAIIADILLKGDEITTVIVYAAIKTKEGLSLDASFRAKKENINLNEIIKKISSQGGARKYKGAYQINLDYFAKCPDSELLWELIRLTTNDQLIKARDNIYVTEIQGVFKKMKGKLGNFFK